MIRLQKLSQTLTYTILSRGLVKKWEWPVVFCSFDRRLVVHLTNYL